MSDTLSDWVWETRYRQQGEREILDSWKRVARALASVEQDPAGHYPRFLSLLNDFRFLPGGRILAGAGTGRDVTLFNCFVMGDIEDSLDGIFQALRESALTMQMGGGIGLDFSTLRPAGMRTRRVGVIASGPVSFMHVWDAMCATLVSSGNRREAMRPTSASATKTTTVVTGRCSAISVCFIVPAGPGFRQPVPTACDP